MKNLPEKHPLSLKLAELANYLSCKFEGEGKTEIRGVSSLEKAKKGDISFLSHPKYRKLLEKTKASAAIIPLEEKFNRIPVIKAENPYLSFIKAVNYFYKPYRPEPGIHPSALVSSSAKIGKNVSIGALSVVGDKVEIGEGTTIFPLVCVYPNVIIGKHTILHSHVSIREGVKIGNRVIIHNGTILGSEGFGYIQTENNTSQKIPQKGIVVIEDDVEIGANSTVDRATLGETIIRKGVKIDNLVQIAHNVEIGSNSLLAAQTGIAGSTKLGKKVITGGQVGITDHTVIEDNVMVAAKSGITKHIPSDSVVAGIPHMDIKNWRKACVSISHLYDHLHEFKNLKKRVEDLEKKFK